MTKAGVDVCAVNTYSYMRLISPRCTDTNSQVIQYFHSMTSNHLDARNTDWTSTPKLKRRSDHKPLFILLTYSVWANSTFLYSVPLNSLNSGRITNTQYGGHKSWKQYASSEGNIILRYKRKGHFSCYAFDREVNSCTVIWLCLVFYLYIVFEIVKCFREDQMKTIFQPQ